MFTLYAKAGCGNVAGVRYAPTTLARDDETLQDDRRKRPVVQIPTADHLFLVLECARPFSSGLRCDLKGVTEVTFSRGDQRAVTCERLPDGERIALCIPDPWMSGEHARLVRTPSGFKLEDTGSRNGTILDGESVKSAPIEDGSLIELGRTLFVYRKQLRTPESTPKLADAGSSEAGAPLSFAWTLLPDLAADFETLVKFASSNVPILLLGETGTGKEVLARMVHTASMRHGQYIAQNCGSISHDLVSSTLFGTSRGGFTGAADKLGLFRSANHGTVLLDEIGDLPSESQAALLRVLQESEVVPVGETRPIPIDVRVLAATHAPLRELSGSGKFRQDLYERLAGHVHHVPALREHPEDMGLLIARILSELRERADLQFTAAAGRALLCYEWPGNVRQLRQVLRAALIRSGGAPLDLQHFPLEVAACADADLPTSGNEPGKSSSRHSDVSRPIVTEAERELAERLEQLLTQHRGNITHVAAALGKHRMQVQRWMKRFGLERSLFAQPGDASAEPEG